MLAVPVIHVPTAVAADAPVIAPDAQAAAECRSNQEVDHYGKCNRCHRCYHHYVVCRKGAYKHLKGEGACCGGGSKPEIPKKKLDGTKLGEKTMKITGMHCENCVASVTRAINRIDGAAAKVNLKKGEAVVSYDREISNDELKKVVEDRGYHVVSIQ